MTTPRPDRPRVTFALFAFNQEGYIREAVEAALAQSYAPLQIILSDDVSSDRTYQIMQQVVAAYDGPHEVILRQNPFNFGTALHVQSAFALSNGALFVVAAGDDISVPERVEMLVDAWSAAGRPEGVIHSGRERFRDGQTVDWLPAKRVATPEDILGGYAQAQWLPAAAPTCAYTRGVFERFGPLTGGSIIEDMPLLLRAALIGRFIACDAPLVRQRLHDAHAGTGYTIRAPGRWNRFLLSKIIAFRTMLADLARCEDQIPPETYRRVEKRLRAALIAAPALFLPETRPLGPLARFRLGLRIVGSATVTGSILARIDYALSFLDLGFHTRLKARLESRRR